MWEVFNMSKALKQRQGSAITAKERERFLEVLSTTFNVSRSAKAIGRNRTSLYKLRGTIPEFAAAWDEVIEECLDDVESVVFERALEGKQAVNNIFLLRHRRAHIYGEKFKVEHDHQVDVIVELIPPRTRLVTDVEGEVVDEE